MERLSTINFARLKNENHAQFHESVASLIERATPEAMQIEPLYNLYRQALDNELESLSVIVRSDMTDRITEQDAVRDSVYRYFSNTVKNFRNHYDAQYRVAANLLWKVFLHYGDVTRKSLDAQTAATNDIIREFEQRPELAEALTTLNLNNLKNKVAEENAKFHNLMLDRYSETTGRTTHRMKNTRVETDRYYRFIVAELEKQLMLGNTTSEFTKLTADINSAVKRHKDILAAEFGRRNTPPAKEKTIEVERVDENKYKVTSNK